MGLSNTVQLASYLLLYSGPIRQDRNQSSCWCDLVDGLRAVNLFQANFGLEFGLKYFSLRPAHSPLPSRFGLQLNLLSQI